MWGEGGGQAEEYKEGGRKRSPHLARKDLKGDIGLIAVEELGLAVDTRLGQSFLSPSPLGKNAKEALLSAIVACQEGESEIVGVRKAVAKDRPPHVVVEVPQNRQRGAQQNEGESSGERMLAVGCGSQEGCWKRQLWHSKLQSRVQQRDAAHQMRVVLSKMQTDGA